jgi:hypothetical protein
MEYPWDARNANQDDHHITGRSSYYKYRFACQNCAYKTLYSRLNIALRLALKPYIPAQKITRARGN